MTDETRRAQREAEKVKVFYQTYYNAIFTDRKGKTTEWDFTCKDGTSKACGMVNSEADLHNTRGCLPDIGKVYKVELYSYNAQTWYRWYY
jgi:hypothetical protein